MSTVLTTATCYLAASGAYLTNRGAVREHNEDACLFGVPVAQADLKRPVPVHLGGDRPWLLAVADGMGGENAGERASREVVMALAECQAFTPSGVTNLLCRLNEHLFNLGQPDVRLAGMGAAVAGLCFGPDGLFGFNVGDARLYRLQDSFLALVTEDDSLAQLLVEAGQADRDALRPEERHALTQSLGGRHELVSIEPHIYPLRLRLADRFLLCTDGLTDCVSLDEIEAAVASEPSPAAAVERLFKAAMAAGGNDNITIILADVSTEQDEGAEETAAPPAQ
ncbi:MAG: serine/threonine-protein phosphatase [Verrucomicrobia bacterium]|nr:serine/threonine-protein phosphatase [Verrucomicrobiota bacterium]